MCNGQTGIGWLHSVENLVLSLSIEIYPNELQNGESMFSIFVFFYNIDLVTKINAVEWFSVPGKLSDCKVVEFVYRRSKMHVLS